MVTAELDGVKTLEEFHYEIRKQQEEAHGADYCAIHDAIFKYMKDCNSYMELGINQGGTASAALLCNPKEIYLIDIDLTKYNTFLKSIAEAYSKKNNIKLDVKKIDSKSAEGCNNVDMLVIDSDHNPIHMSKELNLHGPNVNKYIIAHDTSIINKRHNESLYYALESFGNLNNWSVIERGVTNVGYTVLRKNSK